MQYVPADWITVDTLFTTAGATTVIFAMTTVLHGLWDRLSPKIIALVFSFIITFLAIHVRNQPWNLVNILLAFVNGCVIYVAAVGVNNIVTWRAADGQQKSSRWWV